MGVGRGEETVEGGGVVRKGGGRMGLGERERQVGFKNGQRWDKMTRGERARGTE